MNHHYEDITSRIAEPPKWFDEHSIPRYCDFAPNQCANIYAREACLALITCQNCGYEFRVAFTDNHSDRRTLREHILDETLHYGDPPNMGCCAAGPTMNSEPRKVLEFWSREPSADNGWPTWVRKPELEVDITPDWVRE